LPEREKSLINRVRRRAGRGPGVITGIGDDCAVLRVPAGHQLLVTTDFSLENVHFRRAWHTPEVVGWRCLTRGLSDIAAMGGEPRAAFLSLALDRKTPQAWVNKFLDGLLRAAAEFRIPLAGGDTAQSDGGIQADIVVVGSVPRGKAVLRSGARAGDLIYVTGELGGSAAALKWLTAGAKAPVASGEVTARLKSCPPEKLRALASGGYGARSHGSRRRDSGAHSSGGHDFSRAANVRTVKAALAAAVAADFPRHFHPTARVQIGQWLRRRGLVSAMIDLSDGLSTDLQHISDESNVGAVVEATAIPRALVGRPKETVSLDLALHGGEDYELLFTSSKTIPPRIAGVPVTPIGHVTRKNGMMLVDQKGRRRRLTARGWEHFQGST
jgi:thiamine-monophosphate kinase